MSPQDPSMPSLLPENQPVAPTQPPQPIISQPQLPPVAPVQPVTTPPASFNPDAYFPPHSSTSPSSSKRLLVFAGVAVVLILLAGGALLALGSKTKTPKSATNAYQPITSGSTEKTPTKPAAALTKTPLNKLAATDLGYTVLASELVRNYPAEHSESGQETVFVKVTISDNGSKYTGASPYSTDFRLVSGANVYSAGYIVSHQEATAAGYPPLPTEAAAPGKPVTGYLNFDVPTGTSNLTLRYIQRASKVLNSSESIPAKNYDIEL